jgi:branched-chain amino acid transport system permease protein
MITTIWSGLTLGSVYALAAAGFALSMLPSGVLNFAQGALIVGGTFLCYQALTVWGLPIWASLLINAAAGIAIGIACELITVRPLRMGRGTVGGGAPAELITTVGMATVISGVVGLIWGYDPVPVPFRGPTGLVHVFGAALAPVEIMLVGAAILVAVVCSLLFRWTKVGQSCLAVAEDREAAMLRGINVSLLSLGGFAAAGLLAGLASILIGPVTYALTSQANTFALGGFVAVAIGGEGSFIGALLGGLGVGLVSSFAARYVGANYAELSTLVVLLATLGLRPMGIGAASRVRHV